MKIQETSPTRTIQSNPKEIEFWYSHKGQTMKGDIYTREREIRCEVCPFFLTAQPFAKELKSLKKYPRKEQIELLTDKIFKEVQARCDNDPLIQEGKKRDPFFSVLRHPILSNVIKTFDFFDKHPEKLHAGKHCMLV